MNVHYFESTRDAYDACQCDDNIKQGDLLIIESEGVVGIADTWPVAITTECGDLHRIENHVEWAKSFDTAELVLEQEKELQG